MRKPSASLAVLLAMTVLSALLVLVASPAHAETAKRGTHYKFTAMYKKQPVRWDPCTPIRYKVRPSKTGSAGTWQVRQVRRSVRHLSNVAGMKFRFDGRTKVVPDHATHARKAKTDVIIAFAEAGAGPRRSSLLHPSAPSGASWMVADPDRLNAGEDGYTWRMPYMGVALINSRGLPKKMTRPEVLSSLGKLVGLDYVRDLRQVMGPTWHSSPRRYQFGDRAGLRAIGRAAGCLTLPKPGQPNVALRGDHVDAAVPAVPNTSGKVSYQVLSLTDGYRDLFRTTPFTTSPKRSLRLSGLIDVADDVTEAQKYLWIVVMGRNKVGQAGSKTTRITLPALEPQETATTGTISENRLSFTLAAVPLVYAGTTTAAVREAAGEGTVTATVTFVDDTTTTRSVYPTRTVKTAKAIKSVELAGQVRYYHPGTGAEIAVNYDGRKVGDTDTSPWLP